MLLRYLVLSRFSCHRCPVLGSDLGNAHAHRANASLHRACRVMPITHDSRMTRLSAQVGKLLGGSHLGEYNPLKVLIDIEYYASNRTLNL